MTITSTSVSSGDTAVLNIQINNDDQFLAFQLEFVIPDAFMFIPGSVELNPLRISDHIVEYQYLSGNTLRILSYSPTNEYFLGDTGTVASFQLLAGTAPGTYDINIINPIIGNYNSENILTGSVNGQILLHAPDILIVNEEVNFGNVVVGNTETQSVVLHNLGNTDLEIIAVNVDHEYFSVINSFPLSIPPQNQVMLGIIFEPDTKGAIAADIIIISNDPDENPTSANLLANAYTVNEIHAVDNLCNSGDTISLPFTINNMEPMVSFQFDLLLPPILKYINGSALLSQRKTNHIISANYIGSNILRILSYSPSNQIFSGSDGQILELNFSVEGPQGTYSLNLSNGVIGNTLGEDVCSGFYNAVIDIAAPNILVSDSISLGEVSVLEDKCFDVLVTNSGNSVLEISNISFSDTTFKCLNTLPVEVGIGQGVNFSLLYSNSNKGEKTAQMNIFSNDPDENKKVVSLHANSFAPNYAALGNVESFFIDTVYIPFNVDNYESFNSFQFDIIYPDYMDYLPETSFLTTRAQNHVLISAVLNANCARVFGYSPSLQNFSGHEGAVAYMTFAVNTDSIQSSLLQIDNAILGGNLMTDILYAVNHGLISVIGPSVSVKWTGAEDRLWSNSANWNTSVPNSESWVVIPGTPLNQPILNTNAFCKRLVLNPGSELIINTGKQLTISDSLIIFQDSSNDSTKLIIKGGVDLGF